MVTQRESTTQETRGTKTKYGEENEYNINVQDDLNEKAHRVSDPKRGAI